MTQSSNPLIVGVGASTGGLDAFESLLTPLGATPGFAVVFVQHLDPSSKSLLSKLLEKVTDMEVVHLDDGRKKLKANTVYICPPQSLLTLQRGFAVVSKPENSERQSHVIDHFFHGIAEDQGDRGIGVILSGTGSDGTPGLKAISDRGGLTFAQDAVSANFDSMPRCAATTGVADHVLTPGKIADELLQFIQHLREPDELISPKQMHSQIEEAIPVIAECLLKVTQHNFQHYKNNKDHVTPERLQRFFVKRGKCYHVTKEIRDLVLFSAHNLISDPPFSRQDLISCRNLLIYLGARLQSKLVPLFHDSLRPSGYLLLGPSENIISHGELFRPVDVKLRISQRKGTTIGTTTGMTFRPGVLAPTEHDATPDRSTDLTAMMQRITLDEFTPKTAVIDDSGQVLKSSNEELLSMNEELQSANEELETSKEEIRASGDAIERAHSDLENLLRSTQIATIFLDDELRIRNFTPAILEIYDLIPTDIGRAIERFVPMVNDMPPLPDPKSLHLNLSSSGQRPTQPLPASGQRPTHPLPVASATGKNGAQDLSPEGDTSESGVSPSGRVDARKPAPGPDGPGNLSGGLPPESIEHTNTARSGKSYIRRVLPYQSHTGKSEGVVVTFTDVSQLQASELRFRQILMNVSVPTLLHADDGTILLVNQVWTDVTGYRIEDIPTIEDWTQKAYGERQHTAKEYVDKLFDSEDRHDDGEWIVTTATGEKRVWQFSSTPVGRDPNGRRLVVSNAIDITERQRADAELRRSEQLIRTIAENSTHAMVMMDGRGYVTYCNQILLEMTGYDAEEIRSASLHNLIHHHYPDGRPYPMSECPLDRALPDDFSVRAHENLFFRKDGSTFDALCAASPIFKDGKPVSTVIEIRDVTQQNAAARELWQSKQRLELAMSAGRLGAWQWNINTDEVIWSPQLYKIFGRTPETFDGTHAGFVNIVHPDDRQRVGQIMQSSLESDETEYDVDFRVIRGNDGSVVWSHGMGAIERDVDGKPLRIVGVSNDNTIRKDQELELAQRKAHLRRVINNQLGLVGVIDREGILVEVDNRSLEIARTRREDVIGKHFADAPWWNYDPAVAQRMRDEMQRAFDGEIVRYDVSLFAHGDEGVLIDFMIAPVRNDEGVVEYLIPSGVDIRERVKTVGQVRASDQRLRLASEAAGFGVLHIDLKNGVRNWSPEICKLIGLSESEIEGDEQGRVPSFVHPDDHDSFADMMRRSQSDREHPQGSADHRIVRPDGEVRHVRTSWLSTFDTSGESDTALSIVATMLDITRQHEYEVELNDARRHAEAATASKSVFVANLSHEIRTPMTAILGYTDLIRDFVEQPQAIEYLRTIRRNGAYLLEIINDILDLSKIEAGKLDVECERFQPARVIEDVRSIMEVRAQEGGLQLDVEYDGKLPAIIESDAKRLKQIPINLVGNAIKFTREEYVKIRVRDDRSGSRQDFRPSSKTRSTEALDEFRYGTLHFDVIDTGIRMSDEQQSNLFQSFSQGDASVTRDFGGTGLGLAISQRLAEMLGGQITASSTEGVGSTFTVSISTGNIKNVKLVDYSDVSRNALASVSSTKIGTNGAATGRAPNG